MSKLISANSCSGLVATGTQDLGEASCAAHLANSLNKIVTAALLSSFIAGAICTLTGPVTTDAAVIAASVDRSNKTDRLRIIQRAEHNSSSANKTVSYTHTPPGCERAFSPFADPGRPNLLNYCVT